MPTFVGMTVGRTGQESGLPASSTSAAPSHAQTGMSSARGVGFNRDVADPTGDGASSPMNRSRGPRSNTYERDGSL